MKAIKLLHTHSWKDNNTSGKKQNTQLRLQQLILQNKTFFWEKPSMDDTIWKHQQREHYFVRTIQTAIDPLEKNHCAKWAWKMCRREFFTRLQGPMRSSTTGTYCLEENPFLLLETLYLQSKNITVTPNRSPKSSPPLPHPIPNKYKKPFGDKLTNTLPNTVVCF